MRPDNQTIVVVSGGFDPVHAGHIHLLNSAKTFGHYLIVGLNSDEWLERKKSKSFMPWSERFAVVSNLKAVDEVMSFDDSDGTACNLLEKVKKLYYDYPIIFANGGDRTEMNIPEMEVKDVIFKFGVGGEDKKNSSSWILEEWKHPKTLRSWGYYRILHDVAGCKVKELTVDPGKSLSMQRHSKRSEYWLVSEGSCIIKHELANSYVEEHHLKIHEEWYIPINSWHQLTNPFDTPCRVVEIQYGEDCIEEDIERKDA
jgi:cytidyltransferase-like protein